MAMPVATTLAKELDTWTPCVTVTGNRLQEKNHIRLVHLLKAILQATDTYFSQKQKEMVLTALQYAAENHRGVCRKDGFTPYLLHVLEVVYLLIKMGVYDYKMFIAGIIHDLVEDTDVTERDVQQRFRYTIMRIVMLLTKDEAVLFLFWLRIRHETNRNIRWRTIVLKFLDRTHSFMTMDSLSEERRAAIIKETLQEFPKLYILLIDDLRFLRNKGIISKKKYLNLPFQLNNRLHYEMSRYL